MNEIDQKSLKTPTRHLLKDKEYLEVMSQIDAQCLPNGHPSFNSWHGMNHALGVMAHVEDILTQLGEDPHTIELGRLAALLHDIALKSGDKTDHAALSSQQSKYFLDKLEIPEPDQRLIRTAIAGHSEGATTMSHLDLALILADKLHIDKTRLRPDTRKDSIQIEMQKIEKVEYIISTKTATLRYTTSSDLDLDGFLEWPKSITIPRQAATHFGKKFKLLINDKEAKNLPV